MPELRINDRVTHLPTDTMGRIVGLHTDRNGLTSACLEYVNQTGWVLELWFPLGEFRLDQRPE